MFSGVSSEKPRDGAVATRFGLDDAAVVGFVGGLRPWHGVELLPELLERLIARHGNVRLVVVGDGPLREQLEREVADRVLPRTRPSPGRCRTRTFLR